MLPLNLRLGFFLLWVPNVLAQWDPSRFAWYTSDAGGNFANSLPIGNGRLGAAIFGSAVEHIVLNEDSMWSGPWQDRTNPRSKDAVPKIRELLETGDITAAGEIAMADMAAEPTSPRAYNPLANLTIEFGHGSDLFSYTRWLDTTQGTATVTYLSNDVNYTYVSRTCKRLWVLTCSVSGGSTLLATRTVFLVSGSARTRPEASTSRYLCRAIDGSWPRQPRLMPVMS